MLGVYVRALIPDPTTHLSTEKLNNLVDMPHNLVWR